MADGARMASLALSSYPLSIQRRLSGPFAAREDSQAQCRLLSAGKALGWEKKTWDELVPRGARTGTIPQKGWNARDDRDAETRCLEPPAVKRTTAGPEDDEAGCRGCRW